MITGTSMGQYTNGTSCERNNVVNFGAYIVRKERKTKTVYRHPDYAAHSDVVNLNDYRR